MLGAIAANFAIANAKLIAGTVGGSSAMLSEAIHSAVDGISDSRQASGGEVHLH